MEKTLEQVKEEARACRICAVGLPLGANPVLRGNATARILIVGQAPGKRVHKTGLPWNDPSGNRLRSWMGIDRDVFYDEGMIAIVPMGLCYPGTNAKGGDLPPRRECAPRWHPQIRQLLTLIESTLLVGGYAQKYYLGNRCGATLTDTVRRWSQYWPQFIPLPHPSFRNNRWLQDNPWFEAEVLPELRSRVAALLDTRG